MNPVTNIHSRETITDFVKLTIGKTRILLPYEEVLSVESNVSMQNKDNGVTVYIKINGKKIPVYAFDEDLQQMQVKDEDNHVCVIIEDGRKRIGVLCDNASKVSLTNTEYHDLPACMLGPLKVIHNIAISNNTLYCVSNISCFLHLIRHSSTE